jgi:hypothetical protein
MILFIFLLILSIFVYIDHWTFTKSDPDGYHLIDMFTQEEVKHLLGLSKQKKYEDVYEYITTHPRVIQNIRGVIGEGYEFQNYLLSIEKSSVSTCHRDENGQFFNKDLKHPSYTILFYLKELNGCLDIVENSHTQSKIMNLKRLKTIECVPGQAILFDSDMIHSGSKHNMDDTTRIQLKLHHRDDVFPNYLENTKLRLDASKESSGISNMIRNISCTLPIFGDLTRNGQNIPDFITRLYKDVTYGKDKYATDSY